MAAGGIGAVGGGLSVDSAVAGVDPSATGGGGDSADAGGAGGNAGVETSFDASGVNDDGGGSSDGAGQDAGAALLAALMQNQQQPSSLPDIFDADDIQGAAAMAC